MNVTNYLMGITIGIKTRDSPTFQVGHLGDPNPLFSKMEFRNHSKKRGITEKPNE